MRTLHSYIAGFTLSLLLTFGSFSAVYMHLRSGHIAPSHEIIAILLVLFALAQFAAQCVFFLHLGPDPKQRMNSALFAFALIVVGIIVGGTIWIMYHLTHSHPNARTLFEGGVVTPQSQHD